MTSATKRKYVVKEMLDNFDKPDDHQQIVKVLGTPGSNLHEVTTKRGEKILCSLPVKFRKNIWIKRGDFVVIEEIEEGDKVKAEIVRILYPQHIKSLQKDGNWPSEFDGHQLESNLNHSVSMLQNATLSDNDGQRPEENEHSDSENSVCYSSEDDLSDIPKNTNRPPACYEDEEDSTSESGQDL